jgi:hypothetical protein
VVNIYHGNSTTSNGYLSILGHITLNTFVPYLYTEDTNAATFKNSATTLKPYLARLTFLVHTFTLCRSFVIKLRIKLSLSGLHHLVVANGWVDSIDESQQQIWTWKFCQYIHEQQRCTTNWKTLDDGSWTQIKLHV